MEQSTKSKLLLILSYHLAFNGRVSMHCERNEAVEMRGCAGAIAFEYTHERNNLIGEKITGPIIMPKTSLKIYSLRA